MSNALDAHEQQQIRMLGRLRWTLSRIQAATGIPRETIGQYLKAAGIPVRPAGTPERSDGKSGNYDDGVHRLVFAVERRDTGRGAPATRSSAERERV